MEICIIAEGTNFYNRIGLGFEGNIESDIWNETSTGDRRPYHGKVWDER